MLVAAIDVGSNSTRLLVAEVSREGKVIPRERGLITTRLGQGIEKKYLQPGAVDRTLKAVDHFYQQARGLGAVSVVIAATSAVRDAVNRAEFVRRVKDALGLEVMVLSGREEAFYTYRGVLAGLESLSGREVLFDLGGGSTEFIWPSGAQVHLESVDVGAVRATEGAYTDAKINDLLIPALKKIRSAGVLGLVGVGGTVTNLAAMVQKLQVYDPARVHGYVLKLGQVVELLDLLKATPLPERKKIPGLQPERADIIEAGARIVKLIMQNLNMQSVTVSEADLLYGLVAEKGQKCREKGWN